MLARCAFALLALTLLGVTVPVTTTPQPDNAGRLAGREFLVTTALGSGYARYFATSSLEGDATVTRAVIIVHGVLRDADYYFDTGVIAANDAHDLTQTLVIAPQFVERSELTGHAVRRRRSTGAASGRAARTLSHRRRSAPTTSSMRCWRGSRTSDVFPSCARSRSSATRPAVRSCSATPSSARHPSLTRALAFRSSGVSNPSSYLYFSDWRPVPQHACPDFDLWRYGLTGAPRYVTGTAGELETRYVSRRVTYLMGMADTNPKEEDLDRSCGGEAQGPYRFARAKYYIAYIGGRHPAGTNQDYAFVRGVPHDNRRMFTSACGLAGNFSGKPRSSCAATGAVAENAP